MGVGGVHSTRVARGKTIHGVQQRSAATTDRWSRVVASVLLSLVAVLVMRADGPLGSPGPDMASPATVAAGATVDDVSDPGADVPVDPGRENELHPATPSAVRATVVALAGEAVLVRWIGRGDPGPATWRPDQPRVGDLLRTSTPGLLRV